MNLIRTTTLAIGASLIGSSLFHFLLTQDELSTFILIIGILFLLHGTGFLQQYIIKRLSRWYGKLNPVIGIIDDLQWSSEKGTYAWAWSKMNPKGWYNKFYKVHKKYKSSPKPKLIKITKPWTRWFIDRYPVIVNPYGSVYPELNIKDHTIWKIIINYVLEGGIFYNVADIPFYWAYDPKRNIRYDIVKFTHQFVPFYKENEKKVLLPVGGKTISFGPYNESLFANELKIKITNTDLQIPIKMKDKKLHAFNLKPVVINRAIVLGNLERGKKSIETYHIQSLIDELEWDNELVTPLCYIHFGKGKFFVSLLFLEYHLQSEETKDRITNLLCYMISKDLKGTLG